MQTGADAFIVNGAGEVLLIRRADDGCWAMPDGWVEPAETPAEAAVRETKEETGLTVKVGGVARGGAVAVESALKLEGLIRGTVMRALPELVLNCADVVTACNWLKVTA